MQRLMLNSGEGNGRMGEWENGRMGEWENGRMGEWENGGMGEWENGRNQVIILKPISARVLASFSEPFLSCIL